MSGRAHVVRVLCGAGVVACVAVAAGCAPYPAGPSPTSTAASGQAPPNTGAKPGAAGSAAGGASGTTLTPADTTPSKDAVQVLATIPEPIPETERVPPPDSAPTGSSGAAGVAAGAAVGGAAVALGADSTAAPADTSDAIPVPAPTYALGLEPPKPPDTTAVDTTAGGAAPHAVAAAGAGAAAGAASGGTGATAAGAKPTGAPAGLLAGSPPDTCWRVQIGAPDEKEKGEGLRSAAESLLLVPMVVEAEGGLFKVRTRDCMSRSAGDAVRHRALDTGFQGAFRFAGKRK